MSIGADRRAMRGLLGTAQRGRNRFPRHVTIAAEIATLSHKTRCWKRTSSRLRPRNVTRSRLVPARSGHNREASTALPGRTIHRPEPPCSNCRLPERRRSIPPGSRVGSSLRNNRDGLRFGVRSRPGSRPGCRQGMSRRWPTRSRAFHSARRFLEDSAVSVRSTEALRAGTIHRLELPCSSDSQPGRIPPDSRFAYHLCSSPAPGKKPGIRWRTAVCSYCRPSCPSSCGDVWSPRPDHDGGRPSGSVQSTRAASSVETRRHGELERAYRSVRHPSWAPSHDRTGDVVDRREKAPPARGRNK
jgi:hypothetical protein